jgi:hypothetical protein
MRQVIYSMHFRGQASSSTDAAKTLKTTSSGTSCTMKTVVGPTGVETTLHPAAGDLAFLESQIHLSADHRFQGAALLSFGEDGQHGLQLQTQDGHLMPSGITGMMSGSVTWKVTGGSGRFASATGFVASTFTLADDGELSEYQCGLVLINE